MELQLQYSICCSGGDSDRLSASEALHLAWAVTLSQYLGSTDVHFSSRSAESTPAPWQIELQLENTVAEECRKFKVQAIDSATSDPKSATSWHRNSLLVVEPANAAATATVPSKGYSPILLCQTKPDSITINAKFDSAVISEWLMSRVLRHFACIIERVLADPDAQVKDVATINPDDLSLLAQWNQDCPPPVRRCAHDLVAEHVAQRPDAPAVCAWDGDLTYQQLDELSSRLAVHLMSLGVGPEVFVPLVFEKSKWNVVAMLGVAKAGGIFTPLDAGHPIKRLQDIAQQVRAKIIVASSQYASSLATNLVEDAHVVAVGAWESAWCHNRGRYSASSAVRPENGIYAIFTSGTTGRPKGAVLEHLSWCTAVGPMIDRLGLSQESRVYQFSSHVFDVSISDILATLCAGACVCIPSDLDRTSNLVESINRMKATVSALTPSVARLFRPEDVPTIQRMVLCGEPMTPSDMETWRPVLGNLYGPVEATVFCTGTAPNESLSTHRNIGSALGGVCWVVDRDDHRKLAPIGAVGELLVEGGNVARGYLDDPEKTAKSFVEPPAWMLPFRKDGGFRRYLTGDLVRYNADGSLDYHGRKDTQVKFHGQRIELAEIEKHIQDSFDGGAQDVIVDMVSPPARGGHAVLVAFILLARLQNNNKEADGFLDAGSEFRDECLSAEVKLRERVPSYMVPAIYIPVPRMPVTVNGKADRRRLREMALALSKEQLESYTTTAERSSQAVDSTRRQPATEKEKILQQLVAEVLNQDVDSIGMDASFFHVGGDSTTAMKLVSLARQARIHFTVPDLLTRPKLSELLAWVESRDADTVANGSIGTTPSQPHLVEPYSILGVTDPEVFFRDTLVPQIPAVSFDNILDVFPLTDMQKRFYGPCVYHQLHLNGPLDRARLRGACETLVEERAILRAIFVSYHDELIQVIPKKVNVPFIEQSCDGDSDSDLAEYVGTLCQTDVAEPLALGVPPLRFILVTKSETEHCLIVRLTHAQYDGVTLPILYRRIAELYTGPAAPVTDFPEYLYSTWAQRTPAAFDVWKKVLQDSSPTYVGSQADVIKANNDNNTQPALLFGARALPVLRPPPGFTLATVVKAAWALTLSEHVGKSDVTFCQMVNGRGLALPGIEGVLGPCFNTIPVRVAHRPSWSGLDLLRHIQEQHLHTMAVSSLGLEDIKKNSTSWPADTPLTSAVVHQHFEHLTEFEFAAAAAAADDDNGVQCTVKEFFVPNLPREVILYSEPKDTHWELALVTTMPLMDPESFDALVGKTSEYIQTLIAQPDRLLVDFGKEDN